MRGLAMIWGWLITAWRWIAGSRIAQGAIAIGGLVAYHAFAKWAAKREGKREERREAREAAYEEKAEHEGDIRAAREKLEGVQQERREKEQDEDPRDRFGRDPWE